MTQTKLGNRLIGVHGKKRAGKGSTSDYLVSQHGYVLIKFADPLKDMIRVLFRYFSLDEETIERLIEGDLKEVPQEILRGSTSRLAMQKLGTEWRRMISERLWIDIARSRIEKHLAEGKNVVVDDVRFPDEFDLVKEVGGVTCRVYRDTADEAAKSDTHASEKGLPSEDFDVTLDNNGTFEQLYAQIDRQLI
ncbi:hypothetical protein ACFOY8_13275 [Thalassospira xianhensis]|uniref:Dephospho-CoA kinase n=1 Tax=Thalassospira xiamenensis TaxID=220697 RepID=A0A285TT26_9PROT|nr:MULTISPECIES: hypothetical protein [Thalassospira]SOC27138.1 hypothetical protein SAMN05428964_105288 [Thalassospira xiamenensis]